MGGVCWKGHLGYFKTTLNLQWSFWSCANHILHQGVVTFLGGLVLAGLIGTGSPGAPRGHLTLYRTADVAELGGVGRQIQTEFTGHWPQGCRTRRNAKNKMITSQSQAEAFSPVCSGFLTGFVSVPPSCNLCHSNTRVQEQQLIPASPSLRGNAGCSINDAQQTAHVVAALVVSDLRPRTPAATSVCSLIQLTVLKLLTLLFTQR